VKHDAAAAAAAVAAAVAAAAAAAVAVAVAVAAVVASLRNPRYALSIPFHPRSSVRVAPAGALCLMYANALMCPGTTNRVLSS